MPETTVVSHSEKPTIRLLDGGSWLSNIDPSHSTSLHSSSPRDLSRLSSTLFHSEGFPTSAPAQCIILLCSFLLLSLWALLSHRDRNDMMQAVIKAPWQQLLALIRAKAGLLMKDGKLTHDVFNHKPKQEPCSVQDLAIRFLEWFIHTPKYTASNNSYNNCESHK